MKILRKFGSTSNVFRTKIRSSTTGNGLTGLTFSSTGGIISTICDNESSATAYTVAGSTIETITTLGTFAAPTATKCRFKEVDSTKHPGLYEIQISDARFSVASSKSMSISITGFSGMIDVEITIQLTSTDVDDAVRGGQTALPNTACTGNSSLLTSGTGADQIQVASGIASADAKKINGIATTAVTTVNAVLGQAFTIVTDSTGRVNSFLVGILTSVFTETTTGFIAAAFKQFFNIASPTSTANRITLVDTATTVANQLTAAQIATGVWQDVTAGDFTVASSIGKSLYTSGNVPGAASGIALVGSNMGTTTSSIPTTAQIATAVWQDATAGDFTTVGSIGKSLFTSGNAPGAVNGLALVGSTVSAPSGFAFLSTAQAATVPTSGTINTTTPPTTSQIATAVLTTQMTESYAADGVAPTLAQSVLLTQQSLHEFAISGTTRTVKKLDGTSNAATFTLDSATAPTSTTRAT